MISRGQFQMLGNKFLMERLLREVIYLEYPGARLSVGPGKWHATYLYCPLLYVGLILKLSDLGEFCRQVLNLGHRLDMVVNHIP